MDWLQFLDAPPAGVEAPPAGPTLVLSDGDPDGDHGRGRGGRRGGRGRGRDWSLMMHLKRAKKISEANERRVARLVKTRLKPISNSERVVVRMRVGRHQPRVTTEPTTTERRGAVKFSASEYLKAAWSTPSNLTHAGLQLGMDRQTVSRMRQVLAAYILDWQLMVLGSLIIVATLDRPLFVSTREAGDETGMTCIFRYSPNADPAHCRAR